MSNIEAKIEAIRLDAKQKIAQLKVQDEAIQARKVEALIKGDRSRDTRKKILLGALALQIMSNDEKIDSFFLGHLHRFLKRADDRSLFNLEPLPELSPKLAPVAKAGAN